MLCFHILFKLLLRDGILTHYFESEAHRLDLIRCCVKLWIELDQVDVAESTFTQLDDNVEVFKHVLVLHFFESRWWRQVTGLLYRCRRLTSSDLVHRVCIIRLESIRTIDARP